MDFLSTRVPGFPLLSCKERSIISTAFLGYSVEISSLAKIFCSVLSETVKC